MPSTTLMVGVSVGVTTLIIIIVVIVVSVEITKKHTATSTLSPPAVSVAPTAFAASTLTPEVTIVANSTPAVALSTIPAASIAPSAVPTPAAPTPVSTTVVSTPVPVVTPGTATPVAVYTAQDFVVFTGPGTDIVGTPQTGTLASCVSTCNSTPGCLGFSRRKSATDMDATQQCYLKQNLSPKTNNDPTWQTWLPPVAASV